MHDAAFAWIARCTMEYGPGLRVLEIGSLQINGTVRGLFAGAQSYTGIDLWPGPGVDAIADGARYKAPVAPDRIVCCEVLEHSPHAAGIVTNAWSQLAPGGWLFITAAAPERPPHSANGNVLEPGDYYAGVASHTLALWVNQAAAVFGRLARCELLHVGHPVGDVYLAAQKALP